MPYCPFHQTTCSQVVLCMPFFSDKLKSSYLLSELFKKKYGIENCSLLVLDCDPSRHKLHLDKKKLLKLLSNMLKVCSNLCLQSLLKPIHANILLRKCAGPTFWLKYIHILCNQESEVLEQHKNC